MKLTNSTAGALTGNVGRDFKIDDPKVAQPLCTILQIALVELLASAGITPSVVVGHSFGEIAAAYVFLIMTKDTMRLIPY
jgi:malonyl CoA-acyl carrier protein transacylase